MTKIFLSLLIVCFILGNVAYSANFHSLNALNLKKNFDSVKPYTDLTNAFYSLKGLELVGEKPQNLQELCNLAKSKVDATSLESIYYAVSIAALATNCDLAISEFTTTINNGASSTNVPELYYFSLISKQLNLPIDSKKLSKNVLDGLKTDSSVLNQAYSLHIATLLTENDKVFYDNIEDLLDQADEVDRTYLQYEGGVGTTSLVLEGILLLSEKFGKLPAKFDQQRLTKFVNYLSTKRHSNNVKSAYFLLRNAVKLTDNKFLVPVVLNRISPVGVSASQPNVLVSLTNVLGRAVKLTEFNVEAESAKSQKSNGQSLISAKKALTPKSSDGTSFELELLEPNQVAAADFYTVTLTATSKNADKRFFLLQNKLQVKIATSVSLVDVQVGVADRDQSNPKLTKLEENKKLSSRLDADQTSKLYVKFAVKDKVKNTLIEPHQTFVKFTESKSGREIIFLAQSGLSNVYSAEIDFYTNAKNFRQTSGNYKLELVVADSLIENPTSIELADIRLVFSEDSTAPQDKLSQFSKRPEIEHLFRQPEPTPAKTVSVAFAILCVLPLVLMIVLWFAIGFNLEKFSMNPSSILFHSSLAAVFGLFYCYWTQLNMFQTLRWLSVIGSVAFISGSKLLKSLATEKEKKN